MVRFNIIDNKTFYIKYSIISVIAIFLFAKCTYQKLNDIDIKIKKFPENINLSTKTLPYNGIHKSFDIQMLNNDSLALFFTVYDSDFCLRIVNLNTFKMVASAGIIGEGPGEIINPGYVFFDDKEKDIWVSSGGKFYLLKFPLDSILANNFYIPKDKVDLNEIVINFTIDNNSLKFYNVLDKPQILYKKKGMERIGLLNKAYTSSNKMDEFTYNFSNFRLQPDENKIVLGYIHLDLLIIVDTLGTVLKKINGPIFIDPAKNNKKVITTYQDIEVDDNYIYCLFSGKEKFTKDKNGRSIRVDSKSILIYDWNGNPIRRIDLDKSIYRFDIDKKNNRFLGYSTEVENGLIEVNYEF
jgi:hypothetical protein